jgi:monoamine oxidase
MPALARTVKNPVGRTAGAAGRALRPRADNAAVMHGTIDGVIRSGERAAAAIRKEIGGRGLSADA